jgi:hypothetical protein
LGSVVDPPVAVAAPVAATARPTRSAAAVSRAKTRKIVEAPWPPASETVASAPASPSPTSRSSSGLFLSSPVALYEGDVTMSGAVAPSVFLGPGSPSPSVLPPPSPPVPSSSPPPSSPAFRPASTFSPAAPVAPIVAPSQASWDQLLSLLRDQHSEQLAELRGIAASLRASVSFSGFCRTFIFLTYRFIDWWAGGGGSGGEVGVVWCRRALGP